MREDLRDVKWDIKKGYGVYRSVYTPQLQAWIRSGQIKKGEVLVWRSGFSSFRPPEQVEELKGCFRRFGRKRPSRIVAARSLRKGSTLKKSIRKILVLDDERQICGLLGDILKEKGYEVGLAYTAKEGLALARCLKPDLVFLDLRLPDKTGVDILRPLKRLPRHPVICIISAYGTDEVRRLTRHNGAFRFIDKPFTAQKILQVIKSATR